MDAVLAAAGAALGAVMHACWRALGDWGLTILLFTLFTKVLLFPVSLWVHRNELKTLRLQPELNRLTLRRYGDREAIAEERAALYRREKVNPLAGLLPLALQILLLIGVIEVIYHPLTHLLRLSPESISAWLSAGAALDGFDPAARAAQASLLRVVGREGTAALLPLVPEAFQGDAAALSSFRTVFLGTDLTRAAAEDLPSLLYIPLATALCSLLLGLSQNRLNPLQREQTGWTRWGTLAFSVGLSLYLGFFVPAGVALYWAAGSLLSIAVQPLCNRLMDPRKTVDYAALEETRAELERLRRLDAPAGSGDARALRRREKADYKRFFSLANKHLVFYSESRGFYKYFGPILEEIFRRSNGTVHYITSDPEDGVFRLAEENPRLKAYYIGPRKLITLFLRMDADVVVMTMSDLENYHYRRSYVRKDVRYIYLFHYPLSTHMVLHTGALDHYDEILCVGEFQIPEIRRQEELANLPPKELKVCGYCQLDSLYKAYQALPARKRERPRVLIAPSWQEDNLLDSCLDPLLKSLLGRGWEITVRPHPEYMKRYAARMADIQARWKGAADGELVFETDFSSNESIYASDLVITDWSGTAAEFSFITLRPCLFIDTPPKINNPDYVRLGIEPQELLLRDRIGRRLSMADANRAGEAAAELMRDPEGWAARIREIRDSLIAHFPDSAPVSAAAILDAVLAQQTRRKAETSSRRKESHA